GIRDFHVTGVQTCALPISGRRGSYTPRRSGISLFHVRRMIRGIPPCMRDVTDRESLRAPPRAPLHRNLPFPQDLVVFSNAPQEEIGRASCRERDEVAVLVA